jgi:hypothetical protein
VEYRDAETQEQAKRRPLRKPSHGGVKPQGCPAGSTGFPVVLRLQRYTSVWPDERANG